LKSPRKRLKQIQNFLAAAEKNLKTHLFFERYDRGFIAVQAVNILQHCVVHGKNFLHVLLCDLCAFFLLGLLRHCPLGRDLFSLRGQQGFNRPQGQAAGTLRLFLLILANKNVNPWTKYPYRHQPLNVVFTGS